MYCLQKRLQKNILVTGIQLLGKTINLKAGGSLFSHATDVLKVSGILATIPANTDFQLKLVVAFGTGITEDMSKNTDWKDRTNSDFGCYVLLPPNISVDNFNQQLRAYSQKMESPENKDSYIITTIKCGSLRYTNRRLQQQNNQPSTA